MKQIVKTLSVFAFVGMLLIPSMAANAQSSALSITPRRELTVQKGTTVQGTLPVTNPRSDAQLTLTLKIVDFTAKDQTGTPSLDISNDAKVQPWSLKNYMTLPKTITIEAGESRNIPFSVTMPANIGAGSYYSAIQYTADNSGGDKNVTVVAAATTLVFVNVPGDAKEQLALTKLGAFSGDKGSNNGDFKLFYFGDKPKLISYTLKNNGNVSERPVGGIILKNSFTGKSLRIDNINREDSVALIGQERRFDACINTVEQTTKTATDEVRTDKCDTPSLSPGRYTITFSAFYGQGNGKSLEIMGTSSFWYLPWWFVVLVVLVILILVALVWWIVNKVKSRTPARRR